MSENTSRSEQIKKDELPLRKAQKYRQNVLDGLDLGSEELGELAYADGYKDALADVSDPEEPRREKSDLMRLVSDNRRWKDVKNGLPNLYEGFGSGSLGSVDCWITDGDKVGIGHYWKGEWKILYGSGIRTVTHFKELKTTELPQPPE